jgi:predicted dehydrogenase
VKLHKSVASDKLRWGILGTADIARKNWLAILNSGNNVVAAVASRDRERATGFIERCQSCAPMPTVPRAFGLYEELLSSSDVDAVYLPLPTALRKEWVLRAAAAGKHVICEKPCAANLVELQQMLEACQGHGVQFMDGVMFMHSKRLTSIRQALDDRVAIGGIRRITSAFTFCAPPEFFTGNIRAQPSLEPQGCLGDLGWYCIRFSLWAMGWQMPIQVSGRILAQSQTPGNPLPVLSEFSGELLFPDGASAGFFCSFLAQNQEWAQVSGTKGYLQVEDFVVPFAGDHAGYTIHNHEYRKNGCEFKMDAAVRRLNIPEHSQAHADAQESNQFRQFACQVQSGKLNQEWPDFALKTQRVMEACLDSARLTHQQTWVGARDHLRGPS